MPQPDIIDLNAEDRQRVMLSMPLNDLRATLESLMHTNRQTEIGARLDALTIWVLRAGK